MTTKQTISKDGLSPEQIAYVEQLETENDSLANALDEATTALEKAATNPSTGDGSHDENEDDITKGLPEEVATLVKGILAPIQAENASLRETIDGERDIRLTAEQIEKANAYGFGDSTELGEVLKSVMQNCGTEVYGKLIKSLDAAAEQIKQGKLFSETGSDAKGPSTDAVSKAADLNTAADEIVKSGRASNRSGAMRILVSERPELFNAEA